MPLITEFMASNDDAVSDGDGNFPDWIEIHNPSAAAIDLAGWHLTDNDAALDKWTFPSLPQSVLDPGEYLVVFASGQATEDYVDAGGNLHTSFSLAVDGGYLALTDAAEQVVYEFSPEYPGQLTDVSYGIGQDSFAFVQSGSPVRYLIPNDNLLGTTWTESAFDDAAWTSEVTVPKSTVLISELGLNNPDWIEVQNVTDQSIDTNGWTVAFNDPAGPDGGVNSVEMFLWNLPGNTAAGQVLTTDDNTDGLGNIEWDDDNPGWTILMDDAGNVVDFVAWGYSSADLSNFDVTIGGINLTADDLPWEGGGTPLVNGVYQIRREGNQDNDNASDFVFVESGTQGTQNTNLTTPFPNEVTLAATLGVGYENDPTQGDGSSELTNLAPDGITSQSSQLGSFGSDLAIDGDPTNFTHTAAGLDLPATWQVDLGDVFLLEEVILHNRDGCCQSRLRDITVEVLDSTSTVVFTSALLNPENVLGGGSVSSGPETLELDFIALSGGPIIGQTVRVTRTPDPDLSGTAGGGNLDEADVLSLGEVQVMGREIVNYDQIFQTDLESAMFGVGAGVYVRTAFTYDSTTPLDALLLNMQYDDGFVAYLNGTKIAERNAPANLGFDSVATAERNNLDAVGFETIDVTPYLHLLQDGQNVLAIHGLNLSASDNDLLINPQLNGVANTQTLSYFDVPTPGSANNKGLTGQVSDTTFSADRGFYNAPFQVEITTDTPGAQIYYTTNGNVPTPATGILYTTALGIDHTTVLRAAAFKTDYLPTNVDTQTYIFVDDVVSQDFQATLDAGFPTNWGSTSADYGLDPDVIGIFDDNGNSVGGDEFGGVYAASIKDDLQAIPTMSIVTNIDDLFGTNGIYTNSTSRGVAWERATSIELINPDGSQGFQVDAGLRIQGGYFRSHSATKKHSFRLLFKNQYGPSQLEFPLFGDTGTVDEFNTIVLRAGANDGYTWDAAKYTEQYTRDEFGRSLQRAIGSPSAHGTFVHLYINGVYWGLYNPVERPDSEFAASYFGGDADNWDAIHVAEAQAGDFVAWDAMFAKTALAGSSLTDYMELQGKDLDGTRDPAIAPLLNVQSYVDYIMLNVWGGNWDWPFKNFWAGRNRDPATTTGFEFFTWDFENTIGNNRGRSPLDATTLDQDFTGSRNAGQPHSNLQTNEEYRILFADRIHRAFFNDGALTPDNLVQRYQQLADHVERAIVGESARWGDTKHSTPLTLAEWTTERDWILNTYLPQRSDIVLQEFRDFNLYPDTDAPTYNQHGGQVPSGFDVVLSAPSGTIYYTLDGSDPREIGGAISGSAIQYTGQPIDLTAATTIRTRALDQGEWSAINATTFTVETPANSSNLRVTELHYNPLAPSAAEIAAGFTDNEEFEFVELLNTSAEPIELQHVELTTAVEFAFHDPTVLAPGERAVVVENQSAFEFRYGTSVRVLGQWSGRLSNGGETVLLEDREAAIIQSFAYEDGDDLGEEAWPTSPDGMGPSLVVVDTDGDYNDGLNWRASRTLHGTPGGDETSDLMGDYNSDFVVDQLDYSVWRESFGSTTDLRADGNGDGVVMLADYTVWRNNLGAYVPPAVAIVSTTTSPQPVLSGSVATSDRSSPAPTWPVALSTSAPCDDTSSEKAFEALAISLPANDSQLLLLLTDDKFAVDAFETAFGEFAPDHAVHLTEDEFSAFALFQPEDWSSDL
ncbi:lamin tail domain-containing protein [Aeoliella sp. ICT_H6.2]|uniref:Lamin tail domain-containing protein n=1 Tax=Aeoliella straminimaris TaxID=2954799 RepID=A0A9X2JH05_9BACT|nr:lamin tail domain-containing protein [Aeoliella straminimaris]MCO6042419.1 lamin tail domain-containing protein [Aeoliella straminimaris]